MILPLVRLGLSTGLVTWYIGYSIPYVRQGVALYSWSGLWYDIGEKYGPSTWYGEDDLLWFK